MPLGGAGAVSLPIKNLLFDLSGEKMKKIAVMILLCLFSCSVVCAEAEKSQDTPSKDEVKSDTTQKGTTKKITGHQNRIGC